MSKKKILDVSRRDVIKGVGALGGVAVVGCGNASSEGDGPGG
jgi:hypothetical protein